VKPLVIAHRGASSIVLENSLAAFRAAAGQGADGVELDIHATLDGEIVVHHDPSVMGLPIAQTRAKDLAAVRLANGEPLPTLAQALDVLAGLKVFVEVKGLDARWDGRFFETLDHGPNPSGYAIHSFIAPILHRLGEERPALPRGILTEEAPPDLRQTLDAAMAQTLWPERSLANGRLVAAVHELGARIIVWTVDSPADMQRLVGWGVDGICTNHPERARPIVDASRAA
jgi:glycerophosphoryl diester phosphodiesterase